MSATLTPLSPLLTGSLGPRPPRVRAPAMSDEVLAARIRGGWRVRDLQFDRLLAPAWRDMSVIHWTPIEVCRQVAVLLAPRPGDRVLDVGSGVGKLCTIGALVADGTFVGVEQRGDLVEEAERLARRLGSSATFIHGNAFDLDWSAFNALYFYNPFDELRFDESLRIDATLAFGDDAFREYVEATRARLSQLLPGTRVVTYHGFGSPMPDSYRLMVSQNSGTGALHLWIKT